MDWLINLVTNPFLLTGCSAWFVAQVAKTIIHAIINKEMDMNRLLTALIRNLKIIKCLYGKLSYPPFCVSAVVRLLRA